MHQVSRTLLLAGVVAFGTLTAACGDKVTVSQVQPFVGVQSVTVTPANATIPAGTTIQLSASVLADASTAKTVTWSTSNAAVATVDATGKVTGSTTTGGTVTIIATATADATKSGAAAIVVTGPTPVTPAPIPTVSIGSVNAGGLPVNLANVNGQVDVTVNTSGGGTIDLYVSPAANCGTNAIATNDVKVATQVTSSPQAGAITLSFNTAALTGNTPTFINGNYCIKSQLTSVNGGVTTKVVATNTTPITLNNASFYKAAIVFATVTGGPTSAISSINGLNYNQGTLTATITPINYSTSAPIALISGYLTANGEVAGVANGAGTVIAFTNAPVTGGVATIVFADTAAAARNIFAYNSLPAGESLVVTSASDAAGNTFPATPLVATAIRIDNDAPTLATYSVITPAATAGYLGAAYKFSSGTTGVSTDTTTGVPGVGGVTTTYYVGAAGGAAFATANSCNITGLTAVVLGSDLANTTSANVYQAKVVVADALGNKSCLDVASTFAGGLFGVDKIAPIASATTANNGAANLAGYNVTKNFSFIYNDTISGFNPTTPLTGTLVRNFYATPSAADCVIGAYTASTKACAAAPITVTSTFGTPPAAGGSIEFTNATAIPGYYTITASPIDRAGNTGAPVTILAAFDNVAPAIGALTQSPAAVAPLGTVTVSGTATDNFDLASSKGRLQYAPAGFALASVPFATVAGTSFGPNFDATFVTSGTATVSLPYVYRQLQSVDGAGNILANGAVPQATITVKDVGTNSTTSALTTIATTTAGANILLNTNTLTVGNSVGAAPATTQASTVLTVRVGGLVADPAFQNQPFAQVDIYQLNGAGELVLVGSNTLASVTDQGAARTYTYTSTVALTAASTNTFYAIGRNAAGDAVISNAVVITNP